MLSPKRVIHRKVQRGKVKGNATRANNIDFGQIALVALEPVWLQARHIEAARVAITVNLNVREMFGFVYSRINQLPKNHRKSAWVREKVLQNFGLQTLNLV